MLVKPNIREQAGFKRLLLQSSRVQEGYTGTPMSSSVPYCTQEGFCFLREDGTTPAMQDYDDL